MANHLTSDVKAPIRVVLCGIGGYGGQYLRMMREEASSSEFRLVGAVDPVAERAPDFESLQSAGVPIFASLSQFFASSTCDLVVISSPMQFHCEQTCEALRHGAHVLCEKPLCSTEAEAGQMLECEQSSGRRVLIGYQWSFNPAITRLKADILAGRFGRPRLLKTLVCWPRGQAYYQRNRWAGRMRDDQGRVILDSPVNNATAHHLHNMLYVLGESADQSAWPARIEGRLLRANPIENYDTAALEITTTQGAKLLFLTTHVADEPVEPTFEYEFERATITNWRDQLTATLSDGQVINYGSLQGDYTIDKFRAALSVAGGGDVVLCGIEAARAHTRCVILAQESLPIEDFPAALIAEREAAGSTRLYVKGLQEAFVASFDAGSPAPFNQKFPPALAVSA